MELPSTDKLNTVHIQQPQYYKKFNIFLSILLLFLMLIYLWKRWYTGILLLFMTTSVLSSIWVYGLYKNAVYNSILYLWFPFLFSLFIVLLFVLLQNIKEQQHAYHELLKSHIATIDIMGLISTMHDDETGMHIQRTKHYVKILAEYLYKNKAYQAILTPSFIEKLFYAAPLHDIGKVGIPDKVLKKEGKLTTEEFVVMKTHVEIGQEMITNAMKVYDKNSFLNMASNIAYYHHERWDGSGYPHGLKGREIPIEAQLMALADVYDALISKRCYKEAFSFEMAEEIIEKESGKHFNPKIVKAFLLLKPKFREVANKFKDDV
jgi:adenylate cyclase